jgi:tetratricopeptide (TPR) repeat protein
MHGRGSNWAILFLFCAHRLVYRDLSNLFWKQGKFDKGLEYGLLSEAKNMERGLQDVDHCFTLYIIGNNYLALKNNPAALGYYNRVLAMSTRYGFYNNMADIFISLSHLNTATANYVNATQNARQAIRYSVLLDNNFMLMRSWLALAKLQNLTFKPNEAMVSMNKCKEVATENSGDAFYLGQAYQQLSLSLAAIGRYKEAYQATLWFDQLKDRVFTAEADQWVARLQTEFEVAQKENTIETQDVLPEQQKRIQWYTLMGIGTLLILLVILYFNFKRNKQLNAALEKLNTDPGQKNNQLDKRNADIELLLKEIHHRVKNNPEIVSSLLELKSAQIEDAGTREAMLEGQNRVQPIGFVHQKLYQSTQQGAIEMKYYFTNLGDSILNTFGRHEQIKVLSIWSHLRWISIRLCLLE